MNISTSNPVPQSNERGMSLAEVVFSMLVLAVVLAGLGQALTFGIKINTENKLRVATLNVCKFVTESEKTKISQSQTIFDNTAPAETTYYVDADGNKSSTVNTNSGFRVRVIVSNSSLTTTVSGVTNVLVKSLEVTTVDLQNSRNSGRDIKMKVEIMRPAA